MNNRELYRQAFANSKFTFYPAIGESGGWEEWTGAGMTRAVIELSGDIGSLLPLISKKIEGCAYFPISKLASFKKGNSSVIISSKEVNIYKIENETEALKLADWITHIFSNVEE